MGICLLGTEDEETAAVGACLCTAWVSPGEAGAGVEAVDAVTVAKGMDCYILTVSMGTRREG